MRAAFFRRARGRGPWPQGAAIPPPFSAAGSASPGGGGDVSRLRTRPTFAARQRAASPGRRGAGFHPPFLFALPKRKAPWTVEKKRALFLNPVRPDHSTGLFSGFRRNQSTPCFWPRAFRFTRRYSGGHQEAGFRRTGRQHQEAARASGAAGANASAKSAAAGSSAEAVPQPRAASKHQSFRMAFPRVFPGVLRG